MQPIKQSFTLVLAIVLIAGLLLVAGCSSPPSDSTLKKEITEYAAKCTWTIQAPGKEIYQTFSGSRIKVVAIEILARFLKPEDGSVKFVLNGSKTGEGDVKNGYPGSKVEAPPDLSDYFRFEGEWRFRKYDQGWKVWEEPKMWVASFQKDPYVAFFDAVESGDLTEIERLLASGASVNAKKKGGRTGMALT